MKLIVYIPNYLEVVSKIVLTAIEDRVPDLSFDFFTHNKNDYKIEDLNKKVWIELPAFFINNEKEQWIQKREKNNWGLNYFHYQHVKDFPILFGGSTKSENYDINIDFVGTLFFLMHRYHEEVEELPKDNFGRIASKYSFLVRNNLYSKPWADIYIDLFLNILNQEFNLDLDFKKEFKIQPTHDVDRPFEYPYYTIPRLVKRLGGDILKKRSPRGALNRLAGYLAVKSGNLDSDPLNTFQWIMEQSEQEGTESTFHFISKVTDPQYDQDYSLQDKEIRELFSSIHERGHKIGLHPSFRAIDKSFQIEKEFELLKEATKEYTSKYTCWKSRNHYLRWNTNTISELEKSGIDIDQTLGFAEVPGFRCATSHAFKAFNFNENRTSSIILEPLIVMEVSLFDETYLSLDNRLDDAWLIVNNLKTECRKYGGKFTVLWHNNHLIENKFKSFYKECLK